ncbi:hypothetical protein HK104_008983 [Borealophlyctis nickersoniae]|nr:hypothetical protein HK104_008983 [Borealophlyctis nickersoniae]
MNDATSVILACRQLLCQETWTATEARAAVALCDSWLDKNSNDTPSQPLRANRSPPLPTEIVSISLNNLRGTSERAKRELLPYRLVNKQWGHLVEVTYGKHAENLFLHPVAPGIMKSVQVKKFVVDSYPCRRIDVLLGAPMMSGIRILDYCSGLRPISTAQLFVIFRTLPLLVSLHVGLENGPVEWGDMEDQNRGNEEMDQEGVVWKNGFGNLKALSITVNGGPVRGGFDLLDVMAANLGANLEYVRVSSDGEQTRLRSFFGKVAENCPNLKGCTFDFLTPLLFPHSTRLLSHLVHLDVKGVSDDLIKSVVTCVHLKYLAIRYFASASFRHLARGPFLRALSATAWEPLGTGYNDPFALFLEERGQSLEFLESDLGETGLRMIQDLCPELRELSVHCDRSVTEDGVVAFLEGSKKLQRMTLQQQTDCIRSEAIRKVAEERNVDIDTIVEFPSYVDLREESWMGW